MREGNCRCGWVEVKKSREALVRYLSTSPVGFPHPPLPLLSFSLGHLNVQTEAAESVFVSGGDRKGASPLLLCHS